MSEENEDVVSDDKFDADNDKCVQCGHKCCIEVSVDTSYHDHDEESIEFYSKRGFEVDEDEDKVGFLFFTLNMPCPNLKIGEGCQIYDDRPKVCREFHGREAYGDECLIEDRPEEDEDAE